MSLVSVDAVSVAIHVPVFTEDADSSSHGITGFEVSGLMLWATARQLREIASNTAMRRTVGGQTGAQVYMVFTGTEQEAITGYYLLQRFTLGPANYTHRKIGRTAFSMAAAFLGALAP